MKWTDLPIWRIGWLERAFWKIARRRSNRPGSLRLFDLIHFGFDISYYQGAVNFQKMKAYGAKFLIIRCGYAAVKDVRFDEYMIMSDGLIPVSVYHYYDPLVNPVTQANKVLESLQPYKNKINRVWGDLEFPWTGPYQSPNHWKTYRDTIKAAGYKFGWYTRATWWDSRVSTFAADFAGDPVWAAQYNTTLNLIPKGWVKAHLWQQGTPAIGLEAGVTSKEIDYNLWNTDFNFVTEWGADSTPPPPEEIGMFYGRNKTELTNIRSGPGGSFSDVGDLFLNDLVEADRRQDVNGSTWWHLTKITRNGANVPLPASDSWAWGTNIEETPPPASDGIEVRIIEGGVVTKTYKSTGPITES